MAEVATLYLLGIGSLIQPYYWLFILLISIPFVLICFLLIRLVSPLSFKDVVHLLFYPLGAGVFAGAAFALITSAIVVLLIAVGYIPGIKHDFSQWAFEEGLSRDAFDSLVSDCLKERSLLFTIVADGFGVGYSSVKWPFGHISNIRPITQLAYVVIAAIMVMAAVDRRKPVVFGMVILAGLIVPGAIRESASYYIIRNFEDPSGCRGDLLVERAKARMAEGLVKKHAQLLQAELEKSEGSAVWKVSVRAQGLTLIHTYRYKQPIPMDKFYQVTGVMQKQLLEWYCSRKYGHERDLDVTETHTVYSSVGQRLISFSIGAADCPN